MSSPGSCKSNTLFIKDDKEIESAKQSSKAAGEKGKQPKLAGKSGKQKKKKKKEKDFLELPNFSLELRREEITEDIYGMTGKMPSRTLKKREKNVQKQIERIFPGDSLEAITVSRYKVFELMEGKINIIAASFFNTSLDIWML